MDPLDVVDLMLTRLYELWPWANSFVTEKTLSLGCLCKNVDVLLDEKLCVVVVVGDITLSLSPCL